LPLGELPDAYGGKMAAECKPDGNLPRDLALQLRSAIVGFQEVAMVIKNAPTAEGKKAAASLKQAAANDEKKTEARMGHDLKKGAKRFEERSKSSDGKSAGAKQK
jgi:hypothetical protein